MVTIRAVAASLAVAAGTVGFAPVASAGHVYVGVGIGLPGLAVVAGAPVAVVPPYYYGPGYFAPGYYGPGFVSGPVYGYGYYGRPYYRYGAHGYARGYGGYHHH